MFCVSELYFDVVLAGVMTVGVRLLHSVPGNFMSVLNSSSDRKRPIEVLRKVSDSFFATQPIYEAVSVISGTCCHLAKN
jgi:hypothetical protein